MKRSAGVLAAAAIMFVIVSCGSDSTTGPSEQNAQVGGLWSYNTDGLRRAGTGVSCFISNVELSLNQTGTTFTGNANGGRINCMVDGQTVLDSSFGSQVVVNGTVSGNNVSFDIETPAWQHSGSASVSGDRMSGTVTLTIDLGGTTGSVTIACNWRAARRGT